MKQANNILASLPGRERKRLFRLSDLVDLRLGSLLCEADRRMSHAYFPLTGLISVVTFLGTHAPLAVGLIGREGMLGATLALGVPLAPARAQVQSAGQALRLPAAVMRRLLPASPMLLQALHRYDYVLFRQLLHNTACIHFHKITPRLARCLLMIHDRIDGDDFHLTHSLLANMLGVRRSGVTIAAGTLQSDELIGYSRGDIHVVNRIGLEQAACDCYAAMGKAYQKAFPRGENPADA